MFSEEQINNLTALFKEAGKAHHDAFIDVDGDDPEWPMWYAEFVHDKAMDIMNLEITKSELTYLFVAADLEHRDEASDQPWANYYANFFSESLA